MGMSLLTMTREDMMTCICTRYNATLDKKLLNRFMTQAVSAHVACTYDN